MQLLICIPFPIPNKTWNKTTQANLSFKWGGKKKKKDGFPGGSDYEVSACKEGDVHWEDPLGEEMATRSSVLAWSIPWTAEPGGLHSMG